MKKILFITLLAIFAAITASAQTASQIAESWQKTITVPESKDPLIDRLFTAWGKEFPGLYVNAFKQYKETGKAKNIEFGGEKYNFKIDYAPKFGYLEMFADTINTQKYTLIATYWDLNNGNKLFGVTIFAKDSEGALAYYEYSSAKGTLTPRPELVNKTWEINGEEDAKGTFVAFCKESNTIFFIRPDSGMTFELDELLDDFSIEESIATEKYWQRTITVPELSDDITLDFFMAWCDEFPSWYSEAIDKIEETGKAKPIVWDGYKMNIEFLSSSLESLGLIGEYKDFKNHTHKYLLDAATWTLKNGNPLFVVSISEGIFADMIAFYEYNASAGTLIPRPDITDKIWNMVGNNKHKTLINFYMGPDKIKYFDHNSQEWKNIPWDTNEF